MDSICNEIVKEIRLKSENYRTYLANMPLIDKMDGRIWILLYCPACLYYSHYTVASISRETKCPKCKIPLKRADREFVDKLSSLCLEFEEVSVRIIEEICKDIVSRYKKIEDYIVEGCRRIRISFNKPAFFMILREGSYIKFYLYLGYIDASTLQWIDEIEEKLKRFKIYGEIRVRPNPENSASIIEELKKRKYILQKEPDLWIKEVETSEAWIIKITTMETAF
jgi:hypothetical protein